MLNLSHNIIFCPMYWCSTSLEPAWFEASVAIQVDKCVCVAKASDLVMHYASVYMHGVMVNSVQNLYHCYRQKFIIQS